MRALVLNAGSSSLKASVIDDGDTTVLRVTVDWGSDASRAAGRDATIRETIERVAQGGAPPDSIEAVGHRIVHGGDRFRQPVVVDEGVDAAIDAASELAPLHNVVALESLRAARKVMPGVPHVAAFDTSFHATLPEAAIRYPLPEEWFSEWGIRRYGFHGLSVAWSVQRASELLDRDAAGLRIVVAHLGSGCSVTAVDGDRSVWTSMGMTPLEGLMMGTRAGSVDPGILVRLLQDGRLDVDGLADALDHRSGLFAVSGGTSDVRELERLARSGDERARLAIEMFVARSAQGIAAAATSLDPVDALVFTGGIGEHGAAIRAAICRNLAVLGVPALVDQRSDGDTVLASSAGGPSVLRVEAREDVVIARAIESLVSGSA